MPKPAMRIIFYALSFCFVVDAHAQLTNIGFRSGATFSNFYNHRGIVTNPTTPGMVIIPGDPDPGGTAPYEPRYETNFFKDMRVGFFSYLFAEIQLKERLSIEGGLGYSQRGIKIDYSAHSHQNNADGSYTDQSYRFVRNLRLDYIVVPVILQYSLDNEKRFCVLGGIYNSIGVGLVINESVISRRKETVQSNGTSSGHSFVVMDHAAYAKRIDSGIIGGFSFRLGLTEKVSATADVRAALGLVSIPGDFERYSFQGFSESARNISIETGISVRYKRK